MHTIVFYTIQYLYLHCIQYNTPIQYNAIAITIKCNAMQCHAMPCHAMHTIVLYALQCNCNTIQYNAMAIAIAMQCNAIKYNTIQ
jgi:hypothetical protein